MYENFGLSWAAFAVSMYECSVCVNFFDNSFHSDEGNLDDIKNNATPISTVTKSE